MVGGGLGVCCVNICFMRYMQLFNFFVKNVCHYYIFFFLKIEIFENFSITGLKCDPSLLEC